METILIGVTCDVNDPNGQPCQRWTGHEGVHAGGGDCPTCQHPHISGSDGEDGGCSRCECVAWG